MFDQMLKVLATLVKTHLGTLSDIAATFSDHIWSQFVTDLLNQVHYVLNRIWWHINVVYLALFLHNFLNVAPEPEIEGVQVGGPGGPINSSTVSFVCISGNYSGLEFAFEKVKNIFGRVRGCTVLLKPIL